MRDTFEFAIADGPLTIPGAEDGANGAFKLGRRIFGKVNFEAFFNYGLEFADKFSQIFLGQLAVQFDFAGVFFLFNQAFKGIDLAAFRT